MDLEICLKKLELIGVLAFATVDKEGAPQIRNISAIHYEKDRLYFFTARGKNFCQELMEDGRVQVLGYTKYKEMIRLSGRAYPVEEKEQKKWQDVIFKEQPYLANVYPGDTKDIGIIFCIDSGDVEYFNLGVNPIFREIYPLGNATIKPKGGGCDDTGPEFAGRAQGQRAKPGNAGRKDRRQPPGAWQVGKGYCPARP